MKRYLPAALVASLFIGVLAWAAQQEDQPHASADRGELMLAVRADTAASTGGTDGDYSALITDATGRLHVAVAGATASLTAVVPGTGATNLGKAEDGAHTSGDVGVAVWAIRTDTQATFGADNDYAPLQTDKAGNLRVETPVQETVTLLASAAQTDTNTGTTAVSLTADSDALVWELDVTAAATDAGDQLDVFIQCTVDGTNWVDIVHFTQVVGNGGAKRFYAKTTKGVAETMFENASALAAGSIRNLFGRQYRARWTVTDAGGDNASWTFSINANAG